MDCQKTRKESSVVYGKQLRQIYNRDIYFYIQVKLFLHQLECQIRSGLIQALNKIHPDNDRKTVYWNVKNQNKQTGQDPARVYMYRQILDSDGEYELKWNINETDIEFEVTVRTTGYIGFGLSEDGRMSPADMVIGWVDVLGPQESNIYFGDYHTVGQDSREPSMDDSQDWFLSSKPGLQFASEADGYTTIAFERKLNTCDRNDTDITEDTMTVIWSYNHADPNITTGLWSPHGPDKRGATKILFKGQNQEPDIFPPEGSYSLPLQISNYTVPSQLSTRQCLVYNLSDSMPPNSKLIMFEPVIPVENEPYLYRMVLSRCYLFDKELVNNRFDCTDGGPAKVKDCFNIVATWSRGAKAFYFPEDSGLSLNGPNDPAIYILDIHYTNADSTSGIIDNSGINLIYTTSPRQKEAAFLTIGEVVSTNARQLVPPGETNFKTTTFCSQRCVKWGFQNTSEQMRIVGVIFHGNDIAKEMKLRHFRGNVELAWISVDRKYDSFYQVARMLENPVLVEKTDVISLECTYDSSGRNMLTKGGWSQVEELCQATLIYYPRLSFDRCFSWSSFDKLVTPTGEKVRGQEALQHFENITVWDQGAKDRLAVALQTSAQSALCSAYDQDPMNARDRFMKPEEKDLLLYEDPTPPACVMV